MVYKAIAPEKVISIKCTLAEYNSKEFKENFNVALESDAGKIVIEIDKKERFPVYWWWGMMSITRVEVSTVTPLDGVYSEVNS